MNTNKQHRKIVSAEAKEKNNGKPGTTLRAAAKELNIDSELRKLSPEEFKAQYEAPSLEKLNFKETDLDLDTKYRSSVDRVIPGQESEGLVELLKRKNKEANRVPCDGKTGGEWIKSFDLAKEGESQQRTAIYIPVMEGKPNVLDICKLALESCKTEAVEDYGDSRKGLTNWESSYNADLVQQALDELNSIKP